MSATQEARSHFVYLLRPKRPATVKDLTPEEEAILDEHRVYLRSLAEAGCLVLAGTLVSRNVLSDTGGNRHSA
ncbi:MAG: hypothetical protein AB1645_08520 [Bacillota bacterium]|jgi:hypothetical protein